MLSWVTMDEELSKMGKDILNRETIETLRNWSGRCPYLPRLHDNEYAIFLYNCISNDVLAMHNLQSYFTLRAWMPQFFLNRDPFSDEMRNIFKSITIIPLRIRTFDGRRVIFITLIDNDPDLFDFTAFIKYLNMVLDICIYEEGITNGFVFLIDIHRMTMLHVRGLCDSVLSDILKYFMGGFPAEWNSIHIVNSDKNKNLLVHSFIEALVERFKYSWGVISICMTLHDSWFTVAGHVSLHQLPHEVGPVNPQVPVSMQRDGHILDLHEAQIKKLESHAYTLSVMDQRLAKVREVLLLLKKNSDNPETFRKDLDYKINAMDEDGP